MMGMEEVGEQTHVEGGGLSNMVPNLLEYHHGVTC